MDKRQKALGIEFEEDDLWVFLCGQSCSAKADFSVSGKYVSGYEGPAKLSFCLDDSPMLQGNYVLLSPSWGRHSTRKMWFLTPASGKEHGRQ